MTEIEYNIQKVRENIALAAQRYGRDPQEITLVAVSKTVGPPSIMAAYEAGINNFGENRAQDLREKYDQISSPINWHFIGHLQSNKVKYIIDKVTLIHSLDGFSLAKEINKQAEKFKKTMDVLVQVNVAEEKSKFGLAVEETESFIHEVSKNYPNINIKGLMTIAPYVEDPEEVRPVFAKLRDLKEKLQQKEIPRVEMKYLSMGMTNDYMCAIEEGANIVRIGTAIFGPRK
ncbi:MAG: dependent protein [Clostridia bacterium]|jgi:hypothetical protein|nr:YggS family pyridoxal phosphate-dependent enzyme [Clostridiales bacterium]MDK2986384.1 dependent protein [Clostridia bacterium]